MRERFPSRYTDTEVEMTTHKVDATAERRAPGIAAPHLDALFEETSRPFRDDRDVSSIGRLPPCPLSPRDAGLSLDQICELLIRHLMVDPTQRGIDLVARIKLAWPVLEPACKTLHRAGCIEINRGKLLPDAAARITLTALGRDQARKSFERDRYVGPAPVSLADYVRQCRRQTPSDLAVARDDLLAALDGLCVNDGLFDAVGSAISAAGSMLLIGGSGHGKTALAKRIALAVSRAAPPICVPYAVLVDGKPLNVFDPQIHLSVPGEREAAAVASFPNDASHESWAAVPDLRWRLVQRPRVILGREAAGRRLIWPDHFAEAPSHVKANGGVLILDDLPTLDEAARARLSLMLDEGIDPVVLPDGRTLNFPVGLFLIGCSREPRFDVPLRRRFARTISLTGPTLDEVTDMLTALAGTRGLDLSPELAKSVVQRNIPPGRPFNFSDPHNLLETLLGICRFREMSPVITEELLTLAARRTLGCSGPRTGENNERTGTLP